MISFFKKLLHRAQLGWFILGIRIRFFFIKHPLIGPLPTRISSPTEKGFRRLVEIWRSLPPRSRPLVWTGLAGMVFLLILLVFAFTPPLGNVKKEMPFNALGKDGKPKRMVLRRQNPEFVRLSTLPAYVRGAVIVSEDANFYRHRGVDFVEIWQALLEHFSYGERLRGASTITQQVAKNAYLSSERSFLRKLKEFFVARRIERALTKEEILDYYVNGVEFGEGLYGIRAASRFYFQKDPSALGPVEAATLVYFLPSPVKRGKEFLEGRESAIRDKAVSWAVYQMGLQGYLGRSAPALGNGGLPQNNTQQNDLTPPSENVETPETNTSGTTTN